MQTQHDTLVEEWRTQLEKKSEEFDRLRQQLQLQAPLNLDLFRHQIVEEFQVEADKRHETFARALEERRQQCLELQQEILVCII